MVNRQSRMTDRPFDRTTEPCFCLLWAEMTTSASALKAALPKMNFHLAAAPVTSTAPPLVAAVAPTIDWTTEHTLILLGTILNSAFPHLDYIQFYTLSSSDAKDTAAATAYAAITPALRLKSNITDDSSFANLVKWMSKAQLIAFSIHGPESILGHVKQSLQNIHTSTSFYKTILYCGPIRVSKDYITNVFTNSTVDTMTFLGQITSNQQERAKTLLQIVRYYDTLIKYIWPLPETLLGERFRRAY